MILFERIKDLRERLIEMDVDEDYRVITCISRSDIGPGKITTTEGHYIHLETNAGVPWDTLVVTHG